jgi:hypothetical protein
MTQSEGEQVSACATVRLASVHTGRGTMLWPHDPGDLTEA